MSFGAEGFKLVVVFVADPEFHFVASVAFVYVCYYTHLFIKGKYKIKLISKNANKHFHGMR